MHPGRSAALVSPSPDQALVVPRALLMICVRPCVRCIGWGCLHAAASFLTTKSGKTGRLFLLHCQGWLSTMDFIPQGFVKRFRSVNTSNHLSTFSANISVGDTRCVHGVPGPRNCCKAVLCGSQTFTWVAKERVELQLNLLTLVSSIHVERSTYI